MNYLKEILKNKMLEVKAYKANHPEKKPGSYDISKHINFINSINAGRINIIAEIKKASPSKGIINKNLDICKTAEIYGKYRSFISAVSVITEDKYFLGSKDMLKTVKEISGLPVLRKDFIFHESQVYESADIGADCILLISSILGYKKLCRLYNLARDLNLDVLVEAHSFKEFGRALKTGSKLIGINNRNLKTMEIDTNNIINILEYGQSRNIKDRIIVCESAVSSVSYIKQLFNLGINVFLIGSYFMQAVKLENKLHDFKILLKKENLI